MKLQEGENILHELKPESKILGIWIFSKCIPAAFVSAFVSFWFFGFFGGMFRAATQPNSGWPIFMGGIIAFIIAPIIFIIGVFYCSALRKTYSYYITNQRCIFRGGILRRVERSVPYHKITDVEMSQNIIERMLGISSVKIFTPGTGSMMASPFGGQHAEISFVGLNDNETPAETINSIVRKYKSTGE